METCNMQVTQTSSNSVQPDPMPYWAKVSILAFALILGIGIGAAILDNAYIFNLRDNSFHYRDTAAFQEANTNALFLLAFPTIFCGGAIVIAGTITMNAPGMASTKDKIKYPIYILGCIALGVFGGLSFGKELINMDAWDRFQAILPDNVKTHVGPEYEIVGITGTIITGGALVGLVFFTNCIERFATWLEERGKALRARLAGEEVEKFEEVQDGRL